MQYLGGKTRLAPWILQIINEYRKDENSLYVEPFVGGANVIDKVKGKRVGIDSNPYLIAMWKALQEGWIPPAIVSEETYKKLQQNRDKYPKHIVGFVAFASSWGGKWWGGYARNLDKFNYTKAGKGVVLKQISTMMDVKFHCVDALKINKFPAGSLIYCDPPYKGTTGYKDKFNHEKFWKWAEIISKQGHVVLVSEKVAPKGWKCIFEKATNNNLNSSIQWERVWIYGKT